jgi:hypothetical protein
MHKVLVNLIFNALYPWPQAHRFTILDTLLVKWLMYICFMINDTVSNTDWVFAEKISTWQGVTSKRLEKNCIMKSYLICTHHILSG